MTYTFSFLLFKDQVIAAASCFWILTLIIIFLHGDQKLTCHLVSQGRCVACMVSVHSWKPKTSQFSHGEHIQQIQYVAHWACFGCPVLVYSITACFTSSQYPATSRGVEHIPLMRKVFHSVRQMVVTSDTPNTVKLHILHWLHACLCTNTL